MSPLQSVYGREGSVERSIVSSRPVACARASASRRPTFAGSCVIATPTQVKMPNQTRAIWATSVQITERLPPYVT